MEYIVPGVLIVLLWIFIAGGPMFGMGVEEWKKDKVMAIFWIGLAVFGLFALIWITVEKVSFALKQ